MKTVRGKKVIYIFDQNKNVVVTEQFADLICDELNNSIPIEWIEEYCESISENRDDEIINDMVKIWQMKVSEANKKVHDEMMESLKFYLSEMSDISETK